MRIISLMYILFISSDMMRVLRHMPRSNKRHQEVTSPEVG